MCESLKPCDSIRKELENEEKTDKKRLEGCDVCGEEHGTELCPLLGDGSIVEDAVAPPRARLTMPYNLRAKTMKDGTVTVVARENIPANTRFGPFEAPRRVFEGEASPTRFSFKIFNQEDESVLYLDTTHEDVCNWMCLVLPAVSNQEQNLIAFQLLQDIFFSSKRDIRIHEELKVWYAPHYGRKMGVDPLIPLPATTCCDEVKDIKEQPPEEESPAPTLKDTLPKKRGRKKKILEEYIEIRDDIDEDVIVDNSFSLPLDPKRLGFQEQRDWRCSQCSKVYNNCIGFARHLRDHYNPRKKIGSEKKKKGVNAPVARLKTFGCQFCPTKFSSAKLLQKHRLRLHRRQLRRKKTEEIVKKSKQVEVENEKEKFISECDAATILLEMEANCDATEQVEQTGIECDTAAKEIILIKDGVDAIDENTGAVAVPCDVTSYNDILLEGKEVETTEVILEDFVQSDDIMMAEDTEVTLDDSVTTDVAVETQPATITKSTDSTEKNDKEYVCDICSKSFDKSIYLFRHIRKHTGEFACSKCQKVFARKESLLKHTCMGTNTDELVEESVQKMFFCNYCHKSFESRQLLKRHITKHTGDFTCDKCSKSYCSKDILDNHVCPKLPNSEKFSCDICHKTFTKLKYLDKHVPVHTGAHTCSICGKWLRSHDSLINHMRICGQVKELEVNGLAPCPHCKKEFTDLQSFRRHLYEHTHLFACESCGARFRNKTTLASHVCDAIGDVEMVCETCGKTFRNSSSLKQHRLTHEDKIIVNEESENVDYDGEEDETEISKEELKDRSTESPPKKKHRKQPSLQPLICEVCGALFSSTSSLNVHKRLHGEKLFSCDVCGKRFHRKDLMVDHYAVHGEPAIPCSVCFKMFKTKKSLDVHLLIHDGVKRFTCTTCGKQFYQKGNLIKHEEVHNPDRNYPCNVCIKAFSTKEYLTIHLLEHTRGRIFGCTVCNKSFIKEHQLKAHQRIFHSDLSYVCKFCGLHVKLKHSLKRHLIKKHSDQRHLWNSTSQIEEMLVAKQELEPVEDIDIDNEKDTESESTVQEPELLLAVTRIRTDELQQALATGSAHIQQGTVPNTIEISLPINEALQDAIMVETGEDGQQLQTHIIQLPLATEVRDIDDTNSIVETVMEETENEIEIAVDSSSVAQETQGANVTVVDEFPQDGTFPEGTIVLENGTILQQGVSEDGTDVLFYVFTSDDQDCNRSLVAEEATN